MLRYNADASIANDDGKNAFDFANEEITDILATLNKCRLKEDPWSFSPVFLVFSTIFLLVLIGGGIYLYTSILEDILILTPITFI